MYKIICLSVLLVLSGCASDGLVNPLPPVDSPATSSKVTLNNQLANASHFKSLIFTLNDEQIYSFGNSTSFSFYLNEGEYLFGYTYGSANCKTEVQIRPRANYIFNLGPDCLIEMEDS